MITVSSDRGLCGGIHSSVSKATKRFLNQNKTSSVVILGQKAKSQVQREYKNSIVLSFDGVAKNIPTWNEAALIADAVLSSKTNYDSGKVFYNSFKSVIAFETLSMDLYNLEALLASRTFLNNEF